MRRAVVAFESEARVANVRWLWEYLADQGVRDVDTVVVAQEDVKDIRKTRVRNERERFLAECRGAVVLLVGNPPLECVTGKRGVRQMRGRPFEQDGTLYIPTLPPGTALYDARTIPMLESDMRLFADCAKLGKIPREEALDWTIVDSPRKFRDMLEDLVGTVSFDVETTGLYPWTEGARVVSLGLGTRDRQWCVPLTHPEQVDWGKTSEEIVAAIDERLRDCYLVTHNGKFDHLWMRRHYGVDWRPDFDTMLAHYMLDENQRHGLKLLAQVYYGAPNYDADLDTKKGAGPIGQHCLYLAHDVYYTRRLRFTLGKLLREDPAVEKVFYTLMMPLASLFCDVEWQGVLVDHDRYEEAEVYLRDELAGAEREFRATLKKHGIDFDKFKQDRRGRWEPLNLGSPQQVAKLFFEDLKLDVLDRTDGGKPSTNESVLQRIDHPAAKALIKWRGADQNLKMFIEGWRGFLVKHEDGWRLHPSFKLHGTVTRRASCEHPNLQQVPRDSLIRALIMAAIGWQLLEIDLSQAEVRITCELAGEKNFLDAFDTKQDIHLRTALHLMQIGGAAEYDLVLSTAKKILEKWNVATAKTPGEVFKQARNAELGRKLIVAVQAAGQDMRALREEVSAVLVEEPVLLVDVSDNGEKSSAGTQGEERAEERNQLERWKKELGHPKLPEGLLRALWDYHREAVRDAPRRRGSDQQPSVKLGDAVSLLSQAGPQICEEIDKIWKDKRKLAKAVVFGLIFGMWWRKLIIYARDNYGVHLTEKQAQEFRRAFFNLYSQLGPWHERQRRFAMRNGYVRSLTGGKRRLPEAQSPHDTPQRGEALRQAINSPVQCFACEWTFMTLLQLAREFPDAVRPVGTVHDAILMEVRESHVPQVYRRALEIMRKPDMLDEFGIRMRVPMEGEAKIGPWSKGVSLEKWLEERKKTNGRSHHAVLRVRPPAAGSAGSKQAVVRAGSARPGDAAAEPRANRRPAKVARG